MLFIGFHLFKKCSLEVPFGIFSAEIGLYDPKRYQLPLCVCCEYFRQVVQLKLIPSRFWPICTYGRDMLQWLLQLFVFCIFPKRSFCASPIERHTSNRRYSLSSPHWMTNELCNISCGSICSVNCPTARQIECEAVQIVHREEYYYRRS